MAEGQEVSATPEPSMEEILASIRRIIADEDIPKPEVVPAANGEDVIELTQLVEEDGSVVDITAPETTPVVEPTPPPPPPPEPVSQPVPNEPKPPVKEIPMPSSLEEAQPPASADSILSDQVTKNVNTSLAALANVVQAERLASTTMTPIGSGTKTLENMVMELMKPMLKEWLDQNLPEIVDRLVQKEIERISKHSDD
ncbi:MAG: DUF2497 domain-containing protein [Alphaproteobacteria bacterium]|nr:DUF2497 domain-containing protein [Alphaproteobacteria bacterium]